MATPTTPEYEQHRLATAIAEITSGFVDAIPEQDDFDLAKDVAAFIESRLSE